MTTISNHVFTCHLCPKELHGNGTEEEKSQIIKTHLQWHDTKSTK